jgi:putative DNA primase/helicase
MNVRPSIEDVVTIRPAKRHVPFDERNRPRSGEPAETAPPREDSAKRNRKAASAGTNIVTEDGAACRFADLHGDKLRFCHDTGSWFEWDGSIWRQNRMGLAFHWARELARGLSESEPDKVRYVTSKASFAASVERFARHDPAFAVTADYWDNDPFLLGTPGGTVDLKTGAMRPGRPADGITKSTATAPAVIADCPLWLRFLEDATGGDAAMINFLQQWCGYSLTGDVSEQALVFTHGPGGNGKGVFLNTLTAILADYAVVAPMDTFIAVKGDRHSTDIAMLLGARFVTASETEEGRQWAEARIKQLTGGDRVTARFMRQNNFTFKPQFKLTFSGNHQPTLNSVGDAERRRFNMVPFTRKPEKPDQKLEEKLKAEWPAILRWAIAGCIDWQAKGLTRPTSVLKDTAEYFGDQDVSAQWLDEECDAEPGNHYKTALNGALFASWKAYAERAGEKAGTHKSFTQSMKKRGFQNQKGSGGVRQWLGIRLKPATRTAHD